MALTALKIDHVMLVIFVQLVLKQRVQRVRSWKLLAVSPEMIAYHAVPVIIALTLAKMLLPVKIINATIQDFSVFHQVLHSVQPMMDPKTLANVRLVTSVNQG